MEPNYELCAAIRSCTKCDAMVALRGESGGFAVPAEVGEAYSVGGLAVICEAPGAQEAATSRPLVGPAGKIFDGLLQAAEIDRRELVILNRVRCRPPNNRLSSVPEAVTNCDEWLRKELEAYDPKIVVVMGGTAISILYGSNARVGEVRGTTRSTSDSFDYGARIWIATYHPASLLPNRNPANKGLVVEDLSLAKMTLERLRSSLDTSSS